MSMASKTGLVEQIHAAVEANDSEKLKAALASGSSDIVLEACIKQVVPHGTALHLAARCGNSESVSLLLQAGVSVNFVQTESHIITKQTPLHLACKHGHAAAVVCLVENGANILARDADGQTPLHCACLSGNLAIVKLLVGRGAEVNGLEDRGQSPLQMSILRGWPEMTQYLLENEADIFIKDKEGQTPLHYAAEWGDVTLATALLDRGVKVNSLDAGGRTPLHVASGQEMIDFLIGRGADRCIRDAKGKPPIDGTINMNADNIKQIAASLSKQNLKAEDETPSQSASVERENAVVKRMDMKVFPPSGVEGKDIKANVMAELLSKRGATTEP